MVIRYFQIQSKKRSNVLTNIIYTFQIELILNKFNLYIELRFPKKKTFATNDVDKS